MTKPAANPASLLNGVRSGTSATTAPIAAPSIATDSRFRSNTEPALTANIATRASTAPAYQVFVRMAAPSLPHETPEPISLTRARRLCPQRAPNSGSVSHDLATAKPDAETPWIIGNVG